MKMPDMNEAKKRSKDKINYKDASLKYNKITSDKKYFIRTYGCQMNTHDSEGIKYFLEALGFTENKTLEGSDVVVLNTCAIRENAKEKLFGFLSRTKYIKENVNPNLIVVLCGCLMQMPEETEFVHKKHKYVDIVIGTHNIEDLPKFIVKKYKNIKNNEKNIQDLEVLSNSDLVINNIAYKRDSKYIASVNITFGCNNFCTFCIVPYARGKEKSRTKESIITEVLDLKEKGYKEITLLGQNVNSYGNDFDYDYKFSDLLKDVAETGVERIRFVTSNPWNFTDETIKAISEYDNVMPYVHLPVQSGSSNVLKRMNRRYTKESYLELFNKIKNTIPNVAITTDIIVGFPNESDEDFNETLDLVKTCKFDGAYTFIYSKRAGTPAAEMVDTIDIKTKEKRLQELNAIVNNFALENNKKMINKVCKVLILGKSQKGEDKMYGYTDTMKLVNVSNACDKLGQIIDVEITNAKSFSLDGNAI